MKHLKEIKACGTASDHGADAKHASFVNENPGFGSGLDFLGEEALVSDLEKSPSGVLSNTKQPETYTEKALLDTDDLGSPRSTTFLHGSDE